MHACDVCHARVHELRRGRCWGCYAKWVDARPVGLGARCVTCPEQRRRVLRTVELHGKWHPMCFNCAGQLAQMMHVPPTLLELRDALSRERRRRDRRSGRADSRVFGDERRVGQRRGDREDYDPIEDDMIVEIMQPDADELELDPQDITLIHELMPAAKAS
jgi:hypothetical protein